MKMSIFKQIINKENLFLAFEKTKYYLQKYEGWYDIAELQEFELNIDTKIEEISKKLDLGEYKLSPLYLNIQPKKEMKPRQYFRVALDDQVVWVAIVNIIGKFFEEMMQDWSYGNRLKKLYLLELKEGEKETLNWNTEHFANFSRSLYGNYKQTYYPFRKNMHDKISEAFGVKEENNIEYDSTPYQGEKFKTVKKNKDGLFFLKLDFARFYTTLDRKIILDKMLEVLNDKEDYDKIEKLLKELFKFKINKDDITEHQNLYKEDKELKKLCDKLEKKYKLKSGGDIFQYKDENFYGVGVPTGLIVAGFLSNIFMIEFDNELEKERLDKYKGNLFIYRYVDDIVILSNDFQYLYKFYGFLKDKINEKKFLQINSDKLKPTPIGEIFENNNSEKCFKKITFNETYSDLECFAKPEIKEKLKEYLSHCPTRYNYKEFINRVIESMSRLGKSSPLMMTGVEKKYYLDNIIDLLDANIKDEDIREDTRVSYLSTLLSNFPLIENESDNNLENENYEKIINILYNKFMTMKFKYKVLKRVVYFYLANITSKKIKNKNNFLLKIFNDLFVSKNMQPTILSPFIYLRCNFMYVLSLWLYRYMINSFWTKNDENLVKKIYKQYEVLNNKFDKFYKKNQISLNENIALFNFKRAYKLFEAKKEHNYTNSDLKYPDIQKYFITKSEKQNTIEPEIYSYIEIVYITKLYFNLEILNKILSYKKNKKILIQIIENIILNFNRVSFSPSFNLKNFVNKISRQSDENNDYLKVLLKIFCFKINPESTTNNKKEKIVDNYVNKIFKEKKMRKEKEDLKDIIRKTDFSFFIKMYPISDIPYFHIYKYFSWLNNNLEFSSNFILNMKKKLFNVLCPYENKIKKNIYKTMFYNKPNSNISKSEEKKEKILICIDHFEEKLIDTTEREKQNKNTDIKVGLIQLSEDLENKFDESGRLPDKIIDKINSQIKNGLNSLKVYSPDIIIFPEFYLDDLKTFPILRAYIRKYGTIIIGGKNYKINKIFIGEEWENQAVIFFPTVMKEDIEKYHNLRKPNIVIRTISKNYCAPKEYCYLGDHNISYRFNFNNSITIFQHPSLGKFGIIVCYDFYDLTFLNRWVGKIDTLFILTYNKDIDTFQNIAYTVMRLVFSNVVICNTGKYGGSFAISPYNDRHKRIRFKIEGQNLFSAQFFTLPLQKLTEAREKKYWKNNKPVNNFICKNFILKKNKNEITDKEELKKHPFNKSYDKNI